MKFILMILMTIGCVCVNTEDASARTRRPVANAAVGVAKVVKGTGVVIAKAGKAAVVGVGKAVKGTAKVTKRAVIVAAKGTKAVVVGTAKVAQGVARGVKNTVQKRPGYLLPKLSACN